MGFMLKAHRYAVCVENRGHPAAFDVRKIYRFLDDVAAERQGLLRVIDESGDHYRYPQGFFVPIDVPQEVEQAFSKS